MFNPTLLRGGDNKMRTFKTQDDADKFAETLPSFIAQNDARDKLCEFLMEQDGVAFILSTEELRDQFGLVKQPGQKRLLRGSKSGVIGMVRYLPDDDAYFIALNA